MSKFTEIRDRIRDNLPDVVKNYPYSSAVLFALGMIVLAILQQVFG